MTTTAIVWRSSAPGPVPSHSGSMPATRASVVIKMGRSRMRDEVDLTIRVMSEPPQQMVAIELAKVRYVICAATAYTEIHPLPLALEGLAHMPLVTSAVLGRELRISAYQGDQRQELALRPTLASENFMFLRDAILAGVGVGLVPDYVVARDIAEQRVKTALDDWRLSVFGTRMFLLRLPGRYQTLATRTLIDFIVAKSRAWRQQSDAGKDSTEFL